MRGGSVVKRVPIGEAQARLGEIIAELRPSEEIEITQEDRPIARLVYVPPPPKGPRVPGSAIGKIFIISDDDEHLKDFKDYME
jgi:antitoxin (DNA-binding transcriptional repressor) of toxin-antitoxin stability system